MTPFRGLPYLSPTLPIGHGPTRDDVVVFRPLDGEADWVKRLIGLPGETIEMVDGEVRLNGRALPRQADGTARIVLEDAPVTVSVLLEHLPDGRASATNRTDADPAGGTMSAVTVPSDAYFVRGDFRSNSLDGCHAQLGFVPGDRRIERVECVHWDGARDAAIFRATDQPPLP